jgi:cytochrome P450
MADGEMRFYPAVKQLTLELAASSFLGKELGADFEALKRALVDMLAAAVAPIRAPIPGTLMARGVKGRAFMVEYLGREVESRRASEGEDLFTELRRARMEDGRLLRSQDIIDHMSLATGNPPWPY